jgi:hypothetical protein
VRHLDRLLEKATRIDPSTRPSMAKFRDGLHAMLTPGAATAPASVDDAIHRLAELTAADARVNEQHRDRHNAFWESVVRFRDNWFYPASSESVEKVPNSGDIAKTRAPSTAFDDPRHFMPAPSDLEKADGFSAAATLPTPAGHRLLLAYSMRLCQSDAVQIAVLAVASTATPAASRVLLFETAMAELDTAILDTSLAAVGEKLVSAVHPIMSGFAEWVESQSGSSTKRRSREDREAPHLHALRIRPSVVQLSHSRVVAVEVDLSDDSSGVGHPTQIRFRSPTGEQFRDATFGPDQLTSGELTSGTFRTVFDLGEHSETGEWAVEYAYLADAAGNTRRLGPRELATAEIPTVFTVES